MLFDLHPPRPQDFDSFVTTDQLREARHAAEQAAAGVASAYLWGKSGTGKSHLLLAAATRGHANGLTVRLFSASEPHGGQLVLIDNIEQVTDTDSLFALLKANARADGPVVLATGRAAPARLELRDDVRTRLAALPSYRLGTLSDDEMCDTLVRHARNYDRDLELAVAKLLVLTQPRNLGGLTALLDTLDEQAITMREELTSSFARAWLKKVGKLR